MSGFRSPRNNTALETQNSIYFFNPSPRINILRDKVKTVNIYGGMQIENKQEQAGAELSQA